MKRDALLPHELNILDRVDAILRGSWEPALLFPKDDYRQCHHEMFRLILAGTPHMELVRYLKDISHEKIGWLGAHSGHHSVAEALHALTRKVAGL